VKKVVNPPRTSRPTVERRALTPKKRSSPFLGRTCGPALRRGAVSVPATTSAGVPLSTAGADMVPPRTGRRDFAGMTAPVGS
jgi:hypothetical protein